MQFVARTPTPNILIKNETRWVTELREARTKKDEALFKSRQGRYAHKSIRDSLNNMFHGKCAFCESKIGAVATPHIEHFRPKNIYISLTYKWTNLLLSCPICNNPSHKGKIFHRTASGDPLIDPSVEDPSLHLDFIFDLKSRFALVSGKTARGKLAIEVFGLNSRIDLLRERSEYIWSLLVHKAVSNQNPDSAQIVQAALKDSSRYYSFSDKLLR
ncbi:retron system putative HNH endonuclease [Acidovorax sp. K2F]|uniref:retron system putative HNH endonuclease n=1 Tax=Acidovorax sp. K2F TaxID=2978125 RepID=UPI0021B12D92|nr:retron system putative HNH endonuclease [Acidovorax sp. K2F]MCT6720064.1 TIGR02646 family protein [Acidovorax sp. K2F]